MEVKESLKWALILLAIIVSSVPFAPVTLILGFLAVVFLSLFYAGKHLYLKKGGVQYLYSTTNAIAESLIKLYKDFIPFLYDHKNFVFGLIAGSLLMLLAAIFEQIFTARNMIEVAERKQVACAEVPFEKDKSRFVADQYTLKNVGKFKLKMHAFISASTFALFLLILYGFAIVYGGTGALFISGLMAVVIIIALSQVTTSFGKIHDNSVRMYNNIEGYRKDRETVQEFFRYANKPEQNLLKPGAKTVGTEVIATPLHDIVKRASKNYKYNGPDQTTIVTDEDALAYMLANPDKIFEYMTVSDFEYMKDKFVMLKNKESEEYVYFRFGASEDTPENKHKIHYENQDPVMELEKALKNLSDQHYARPKIAHEKILMSLAFYMIFFAYLMFHIIYGKVGAFPITIVAATSTLFVIMTMIVLSYTGVVGN